MAIVGSGPGSLDNREGLIDSHDIVVRVNNYKLFSQTGRRTDVFYSFFGNSIRKSASELEGDGVRLCMCKCPNAKPIKSAWHERNGKSAGIDYRYIYENRAHWWFCDTYIPEVEDFLEKFRLLGEHQPTTGFAAILDILSFKPLQVYLTGFDGFVSNIHNVNEKWRRKNPDDPIGHRPDLELEWLADNAEFHPMMFDKSLQCAIISFQDR